MASVQTFNPAVGSVDEGSIMKLKAAKTSSSSETAPKKFKQELEQARQTQNDSVSKSEPEEPANTSNAAAQNEKKNEETGKKQELQTTDRDPKTVSDSDGGNTDSSQAAALTDPLSSLLAAMTMGAAEAPAATNTSVEDASNEQPVSGSATTTAIPELEAGMVAQQVVSSKTMDVPEDKPVSQQNQSQVQAESAADQKVGATAIADEVLTAQTTNPEQADPKRGDKTGLESLNAEVIEQIPTGQDKNQTGQEKSSEVKKIMDYESQKINLTRLNSKGESQDTQDDSQSQKQNHTVLASFHLPGIETIQQDKNSATVVQQGRPAVDPQDLMDQVVKKAELLLKKDVSEINLQLKPGFLGKMSIKILVDDSGSVTAQFTTSSQQVKNALEQNIQSLRQSLEAQGMKVDKAEVNVQLDSGGMLGNFNGRQQDLWQQSNNSAQFRGSVDRVSGELAVVGSSDQNYLAASQTYESGWDYDNLDVLV